MFVSGYNCEIRGNITEVRLSLRNRDACFQATNCKKTVAASLLGLRLRTVGIRGIGRDRYIDIERFVLNRKLKARRHDTDHGVWSSIEFDRAADDVWIGAEILAPIAVAHDHFEPARPAAALLVRADKTAADYRLHSENIEKVGT